MNESQKNPSGFDSLKEPQWEGMPLPSFDLPAEPLWDGMPLPPFDFVTEPLWEAPSLDDRLESES